ncbi:unnamed protein product [Nezara viridula]|uniref:Salivary secreted peptide n=1 Tax=Nezara viridula TaxID=85310 RepID=A0A9P0HRQ5_NEZVI|nr:unnamed protein product [Nezara viridula]
MTINMVERKRNHQSAMKGIYSALVLAVSTAFLLQLVSVEAAVLKTEVAAGDKVHNFIYGTRSYGDRLLYHDLLNVKSKLWRVTTVDVNYPPKGQAPLGRIDYIEVLDQRSDGTGGYVYIKDGGIGLNFVNLHIKSQRNHGMDFVINVYGH